MNSGIVYEERRGWSISAIVSVSISVLIAVLLLAGFALAHLPKLLLLGVPFGLGALINVWTIARHGLALRADSQGIVLGGPRPWAGVGDVIPWSQVRGIVVFKRGRRSVIGVVKLNAGLPVESLTPGGAPKPDVSIAIDWWKLDVARMAEVARSYAPDVEIFDERIDSGAAVAEQAQDPSRKRRATIVAAIGACVLVLVIGLIAAFQSDSASGYQAQLGPAGSPVVVNLPQKMGQQTYLMDDSSPIWHYFPVLLPSSPGSTYATIGGLYASTDISARDISIDAVYARGDAAHQGAFSLNPEDLANLAASTLMGDAQRYSSGAANAVLECGTYADTPMCVWAGRSVLVFVTYYATPGTLTDLAALTPGTVKAMLG